MYPSVLALYTKSAGKRCEVRTSSFASAHLNIPKCAHNLYFQTENIYSWSENTYSQSENRDYVRILLSLSAYFGTFKYAFADDYLRIPSDREKAYTTPFYSKNPQCLFVGTADRW